MKRVSPSHSVCACVCMYIYIYIYVCVCVCVCVCRTLLPRVISFVQLCRRAEDAHRALPNEAFYRNLRILGLIIPAYLHLQWQPG